MHLVKTYLPLLQMPTTFEHTKILPTTFDKNPYFIDETDGQKTLDVCVWASMWPSMPVSTGVKDGVRGRWYGDVWRCLRHAMITVLMFSSGASATLDLDTDDASAINPLSPYPTKAQAAISTALKELAPNATKHEAVTKVVRDETKAIANARKV